MLHYVAGKGDGEVVAKTFLAYLRSGLDVLAFGEQLFVGFGEPVARVEYLEEKFVAFFAIFAHECGQILHRGSLDGHKAEQAENFADGVEYIVASRHFEGRKVACAFGN